MPSGDISVMPQAWQSVTPCSSWKARISAGGHAEPPMTTRRRLLMSRLLTTRSASRPCQIVGTAAAWVGRSVSIISAMTAGCMNRSVSSMLTPVMNAACGSPQALTWNMGTIGSEVSRSVSAKLSVMLTCIECR